MPIPEEKVVPPVPGEATQQNQESPPVAATAKQQPAPGDAVKSGSVLEKAQKIMNEVADGFKMKDLFNPENVVQSAVAKKADGGDKKAAAALTNTLAEQDKAKNKSGSDEVNSTDNNTKTAKDGGGNEPAENEEAEPDTTASEVETNKGIEHSTNTAVDAIGKQNAEGQYTTAPDKIATYSHTMEGVGEGISGVLKMETDPNRQRMGEVAVAGGQMIGQAGDLYASQRSIRQLKKLSKANEKNKPFEVKGDETESQAAQRTQKEAGEKARHEVEERYASARASREKKLEEDADAAARFAEQSYKEEHKSTDKKDVASNETEDGAKKAGDAAREKYLQEHKLPEVTKEEVEAQQEEAKKAGEEAEKQSAAANVGYVRERQRIDMAKGERKAKRGKAIAGLLGGLFAGLGAGLSALLGTNSVAGKLVFNAGKSLSAASLKIGDALTDMLRDRSQQKAINDEIVALKMGGGEIAAALSDVEDYDDLKNKLRDAYMQRVKGQDPELRSLTDEELTALIINTLSGQSDDQGIANLLAKRTASQLKNQRGKSQEQRDKDMAYSKAVGLRKSKDGTAPRRQLIEQRLGASVSV